jgi:soluble lytic murein transglycosylase-like protein
MHSVLAPRADCNSSQSPLIFPYRPRSKVGRRSPGELRKSHRRELASSIAWLCSLRSGAHIVVVITQFVGLIAAPPLFQSSAGAQAALRPRPIDRFADFIAEASTRFAVPVRWIHAVIQVESAGDEHAVSSRGAMGLMQLMPGTWSELSVRYGFGLDPFDPRGNILAGTAYLKELYDRFGSAGFLAAYHAGPARYEQHLATGQPLPPETAAYVAAVTPLLGNEWDEYVPIHIKRAVPWREAPLFVERSDAR